MTEQELMFELRYPQGEKKVRAAMGKKKISKRVWKHVQKRVTNDIAKYTADDVRSEVAPHVLDHWKTIIEDGCIPFGLEVK